MATTYAHLVDRPGVAVFGNSKADQDLYECARQVGRFLASAGYAVVNGGYGGTMEASAKGAAEMGGVVVGVTREAFGRTANPYVTREFPTPNLQTRLAALLELSEAGCVVLPGGTGTLLELAMAWELLNKKFLSPRPLVCVGSHWRATVESVLSVQPKSSSSIAFVDAVEALDEHFPIRTAKAGEFA